jgi:uncharacterized damage-inducible protein DinB
MSASQIIRPILAFNAAMTTKLWDVMMGHLTDEQFVAESDYAIGSIRNQMVHLAQVERAWMYDLMGELPPPNYNEHEYTTRASVRLISEKASHELSAFAASLDDAALMSASGNVAGPIWTGLVHMMNHGTDHRAQVARLLHDLGISGFEQDLGDYLDTLYPMTQAKIVEIIDRAWAEWESVIAQVPRERMEEPTVIDGLSVKDLIAHITWYEREVVRTMRERAYTPSDHSLKPVDERNAAVLADSRTRALSDVLNEHYLTHRDLMALLQHVTDADLIDESSIKDMPKLGKPWQILAGNTYFHYPEHLTPIKEWLEKERV